MDEFREWPSHFQKPGDEEEDHSLPSVNHGGMRLSPEAEAVFKKWMKNNPIRRKYYYETRNGN